MEGHHGNCTAPLRSKMPEPHDDVLFFYLGKIDNLILRFLFKNAAEKNKGIDKIKVIWVPL